ncbi:MAG TPA: hypothetical protein DDW52_03810, partial [Planctomycetaceae bacterium]|nr:hypothetical protein [Planctomycetaceae bacterium]
MQFRMFQRLQEMSTQERLQEQQRAQIDSLLDGVEPDDLKSLAEWANRGGDPEQLKEMIESSASDNSMLAELLSRMSPSEAAPPPFSALDDGSNSSSDASRRDSPNPLTPSEPSRQSPDAAPGPSPDGRASRFPNAGATERNGVDNTLGSERRGPQSIPSTSRGQAASGDSQRTTQGEPNPFLPSNRQAGGPGRDATTGDLRSRVEPSGQGSGGQSPGGQSPGGQWPGGQWPGGQQPSGQGSVEPSSDSSSRNDNSSPGIQPGIAPDSSGSNLPQSSLRFQADSSSSLPSRAGDATTRDRQDVLDRLRSPEIQRQFDSRQNSNTPGNTGGSLSDRRSPAAQPPGTSRSNVGRAGTRQNAPSPSARAPGLSRSSSSNGGDSAAASGIPGARSSASSGSANGRQSPNVQNPNVQNPGIQNPGGQTPGGQTPGDLQNPQTPGVDVDRLSALLGEEIRRRTGTELSPDAMQRLARPLSEIARNSPQGAGGWRESLRRGLSGGSLPSTSQPDTSGAGLGDRSVQDLLGELSRDQTMLPSLADLAQSLPSSAQQTDNQLSNQLKSMVPDQLTEKLERNGLGRTLKGLVQEAKKSPPSSSETSSQGLEKSILSTLNSIGKSFSDDPKKSDKTKNQVNPSKADKPAVVAGVDSNTRTRSRQPTVAGGQAGPERSNTANRS